MVAHQHIRMQPQAMAMNDAGQALQEARAIALIPVNRLALITARRDVVEGPRKLHSKWPCDTGAALSFLLTPLSRADPTDPHCGQTRSTHVVGQLDRAAFTAVRISSIVT